MYCKRIITFWSEYRTCTYNWQLMGNDIYWTETQLQSWSYLWNNGNLKQEVFWAGFELLVTLCHHFVRSQIKLGVQVQVFLEVWSCNCFWGKKSTLHVYLLTLFFRTCMYWTCHTSHMVVLILPGHSSLIVPEAQEIWSRKASMNLKPFYVCLELIKHLLHTSLL